MSNRLHPLPSASERNAWAREELKLADDAPATVARKRFYERLKESEFVPPESCVEAWDQLESDGVIAEGTERRLPLAFAYSQPKKLLDEVEEFSKVFFDLPIPERESRYRRLAVECQCWPAVQARLQRLRGALKLTWPNTAGENEELQKLLGWIRELVVLPGPVATVRRQAILSQIAAGEPNPMRSQAKRLRERYGECRVLLPSFLEALDTQLPPAERQEAADVIFVEPAASTFTVQATWTPRPMLPQIQPAPYVPPYPDMSRWNSVIIALAAAAILLIAFVMYVVDPPGRTRTSPTYYSPQRSGTGTLKPADIERIQRMINDQNRNVSDPNAPLFNPSDPSNPIPQDEINRPFRSPFSPPPTNPTIPRPPDLAPRFPTVPTPGPRFQPSPNPGIPRVPTPGPGPRFP